MKNYKTSKDIYIENTLPRRLEGTVELPLDEYNKLYKAMTALRQIIAGAKFYHNESYPSLDCVEFKTEEVLRANYPDLMTVLEAQLRADAGLDKEANHEG